MESTPPSTALLLAKTTTALQTPALRQLVKQYLHFCIKKMSTTASNSADQVDIHTVFDREQDHYLLIAEGWRGFRRIYRTLAHIALRDDLLYIYEDTTVTGIAEGLYEAGVPEYQIICAFRNAPVAS